MKRRALILPVVLTLGLLVGCSGCWSTDPINAPTFWDVLFRRDTKAVKAEQAEQAEYNRNQERLAVEQSRQSQANAEAALARAQEATEERRKAEEEAKAAQARADEALSREREAYLQAQVLQAEGDKAIKISVARALTTQSRMTPLLMVAILVMCPVAGLGIAYVIDMIRRRKQGW